MKVLAGNLLRWLSYKVALRLDLTSVKPNTVIHTLVRHCWLVRTFNCSRTLEKSECPQPTVKNKINLLILSSTSTVGWGHNLCYNFVLNRWLRLRTKLEDKNLFSNSQNEFEKDFYHIILSSISTDDWGQNCCQWHNVKSGRKPVKLQKESPVEWAGEGKQSKGN